MKKKDIVKIDFLNMLFKIINKYYLTVLFFIMTK